MFGRTPWCSLTQNYNKDLRWTYCEPTGPGEIRERPPCIFPFTYKGKEYSNCTGDGRRDRRPWCATTDSYDMDSKGKFCQVSGPDPKLQSPTCAFPFIYKGNFYSTCTTEGMSDGKHWCATTSNYDLDKRWMYCNITGPDPSIEGPSCVFPFIFKDKPYNMCTTEGRSDGKHWCATTSNYETDKKWKYCNITGPDKSVESPPCVFPFLYEGKFYLNCTADGRTDGKFWCATSSNYDADKKWKFCQEDSGTASSKEPPRCVFPFTYNGKYYNSCTEDGREDKQLWCATTSNYDRDKQMTFCTVTKTGCVFPFIYKGKAYQSCTSVENNEGRAWCATTPDYQTDYQTTKVQKWRLCNESDCVFPFVFHGKSYHSCTRDGHSDKKRWCSLTANADTDKAWLLC
ncbi:epididymal sperm-binding protein 1 [Pogona vitticeps]